MIARRVETAMKRSGGGGAENQEAARRLEGITRVATLEEAVVAAARLVEPGDVVLFSPGGTSFDAFEDFAERGDRFKALVRNL